MGIENFEVIRVESARVQFHRDGFMLVKYEGETVGSITRPWHNKNYVVMNGPTLSSRKAALNYIWRNSVKRTYLISQLRVMEKMLEKSGMVVDHLHDDLCPGGENCNCPASALSGGD